MTPAVQPAKAKHPGGRPKESTDKKLSRINITLQVLETLYKSGWTDAQIAENIGVTEDTINKWKIDEQFALALKDWKSGADEKVERSLYERACGYRTKCKKHYVVSDGKDSGSHLEEVEEEVVYPPDTVACIFWLKNRKKAEWRDKHEIEGTLGVFSLTEALNVANESNRISLVTPSKN